MNKLSQQQIKLDERNHVELPLLNQLKGLGWEVLDLEAQQTPGETHRSNLTEVLMQPVLRAQLQLIQPWLEDDQADEVVRQLAALPSSNLLQNNQHVFRLLIEGTSVSVNRATGEKSPTVRFIDFDRVENNRFMAVCQFKVRILGTEHHIIPDVVLFVNGIPLVVIEAKSPKVKDALPEAIDQLMRYSEQRGAKGEGSAALFAFNQFLVVTCRNEAKFGTITTHNERHFYRWSDPFPRTLDELEHGTSSPNDQQRLVAGMMDHANLLGIVRTFTIFSTSDKGELIKVVAVNELAAKHFRDERLSMKGIPPKLRQITDAYLVSQGIDVKVKPISILDEDFQKEVKKLDRVKSKAAAIEHAVRNHLEVELNDDPELQASFADALAQIFLDFAKNWAKIYEELEKLRQRIVSASQEPTYGLSKKKQMPFFRMLRKEIFGELPVTDGATAAEKPPAHLGWTEESQISALVALTQHVYAEIERELKLTGFWESIPARNKLQADLQKTLLQPEFMKMPNVALHRKHIISRMMEIAEKNNDLIQFANE